MFNKSLLLCALIILGIAACGSESAGESRDCAVPTAASYAVTITPQGPHCIDGTLHWSYSPADWARFGVSTGRCTRDYQDSGLTGKLTADEYGVSRGTVVEGSTDTHECTYSIEVVPQ